LQGLELMQTAVRLLRQAALDADSGSRKVSMKLAQAGHVSDAKSEESDAGVAETALKVAVNSGIPAAPQESITGLQNNIKDQRQRLSSLMERVATLRKLASSLEATSVRNRGTCSLTQSSKPLVDALHCILTRHMDTLTSTWTVLLSHVEATLQCRSQGLAGLEMTSLRPAGASVRTGLL
jgi:hypothetical protein